MKVIPPVTISDAAYISGPAETDHAAYAAGTTYAAGDRVIRTGTHRIYESLQAGNVGHTPESSPTWWLDVAPTNKWACLDAKIGTATTQASPLAITLAPGAITGLALLELVGTSVTVAMTNGAGGPTVYTHTASLEGSMPSDWLEYFTLAFEQLTELVLTDLPPYASGRITVTLTGGASVSIGVLAVGVAVEIGTVLRPASMGITDYSRKTTDDFGNTVLTERAYARRATLSLTVPKADTARVFRKLAGLRATPAIWIGSDEADYSGLVVYGWPRDWAIEVTYRTHSMVSLQIEGLT